MLGRLQQLRVERDVVTCTAGREGNKAASCADVVAVVHLSKDVAAGRAQVSDGVPLN